MTDLKAIISVVISIKVEAHKTFIAVIEVNLSRVALSLHSKYSRETSTTFDQPKFAKRSRRDN